MNAQHAKRFKQLGMSFGKAAHLLRKQLFFSLLGELDRLRCFRCSLPILDPRQLSMDHKIAWLDNDPKLFWDVTNVTYSHLRCNSKAKRVLKIYETRAGSDRQYFQNVKKDPVKYERYLADKKRRYHTKYKLKRKGLPAQPTSAKRSAGNII